MALLGNQSDLRCLSFRSKSSDPICPRLNPGLIAPVNLRLLLLRARGNIRLILRQPFLDGPRTLLIGPLDRLLRSKTPSFEVLPNRPNGHLDAKPLPDQQLHGVPRPQRKGKLHLVRGLIDQCLAQFRFLIHRKRPLFPGAAASPSRFDGLATLFPVALPYRAGASGTDPKSCRHDHVLNTLLSKPNNLLPNLILRLGTVSACIYFFHADCISQINRTSYVYLPQS